MSKREKSAKQQDALRSQLVEEDLTEVCNSAVSYDMEEVNLGCPRSTRRVHRDCEKMRRMKTDMPRRTSSLQSFGTRHMPTTRSATTSKLDIESTISLVSGPTSMTPSQRLHLRRTQLNKSILKLNKDSNDYDAASLLGLNDDETIDANTVFNVPVIGNPIHVTSMPASNASNIDVTSSNTRTSSIMSHVSQSDSVSSKNSFHEKSGTDPDNNVIYNNEYSNMIEFETNRLTYLFCRDELLRMQEQSFQNKRMITQFQRLNLSMPTLSSGEKNDSVSGNSRSAKSASMIEVRKTPVKIISSRKHNSEYFKNCSFTRPIWLPPKSSYEKRKHHKEFIDITQHAIHAEARESKAKMRSYESLQSSIKMDEKEWDTIIALKQEEFNETLKTEKIKAMFSRGVPKDSRLYIWPMMFSFQFGIDTRTDYCKLYSDHRVDNVARKNLSKNSGMSKEIEEFILDDLSCSFKLEELNGKGTKKEVVEIVKNLIYYFGNFHCSEKDQTDYRKMYFSGLANITAIYYIYLKSASLAFTAVANLYTTGPLRHFYIYKLEGDSSPKESLVAVGKFANMLKNILANEQQQVSRHFDIIGLDYKKFICTTFISLFTNAFNFTLSSHAMDLFLLEGPKFLSRCLGSLICKYPFKFFGKEDEIFRVLFANSNGWDSRSSKHQSGLNIEYTYEFIEMIK